MNAVIDRLVQYPNRFQLTNISDGTVLGTFDLSPVTGTVSVVGTILNHDLFQSIADDLASRIKTEGGVVSNTIETFTMAGTRTNISSGETISVSFGKIAKIINDLKAVAFSGNKADIGLDQVDNTADADKPVSNATEIELNKKVDKVAGSSLMTDAEHNKLSGIADGAEVQSVNSKTGSVVLTGSDITTSSADSEKLDSKSVADMLHLGAHDSYTYDGTTKKYTVTRKTTYNNDGTQSESSSKHIETLSDRYFARTGQPYIEEWKKSEADRSSNLLNPNQSVSIESNGSYSYSNNVITITSVSNAWEKATMNDLTLKANTTYTISATLSAKSYINLEASNTSYNFSNSGYGAVTFTTGDASTKIKIGGPSNTTNSSVTWTDLMLVEGSVALPYQPYEGEVVHGKGLAETLSAYPTSQSVSETYLSKADASSQYRAIDDSYSKSQTPLRRYGRVVDENPTAGTTWGKVADITIPVSYADMNISFLVQSNHRPEAVIIGILKLDVRNDNSADSSSIAHFSWLVKADNADYPLSSFVAIQNGLNVSIYVRTFDQFDGITLSELDEYDTYGNSTFGSYALYSVIDPTLTDLSTVAGNQTVSTMDVIENTAVSATNATNDDAGNRISTTYLEKSSLISVPTENSTNPITSGGVYSAIAKKLDKGDWREYQFDYVKNTDAQVSISPALENGTYICEILARGTGDYSAITTCYSLGVFSGYGTIKAYVGEMTFAYGAIHNLSAHIDNPLMTVRGDLDYLQEGPYTSYIRFRKIADD